MATRSGTWRAIYALFLLVFLGALPRARAQAATEDSTQAQVTFLVSPWTINTPVEITEIRIDDKPVAMNTPVNVPSDWLHHTVVVVKNLCTKIAVKGYVTILFPESGRGTSDSPLDAQPVSLGRLPEEAKYKRDGSAVPIVETNPHISIPPGRSFIFSFADPSSDVLTIATRKAGTITKATVRLGAFYFDNGGRWATGRFTFPTDQHGQWESSTPEEFTRRNNPASQP